MLEKFGLKRDFQIGKTSWLGTGGNCEFLFKPSSFEELSSFLKELSLGNFTENFNRDFPQITILGNTSNVLIGDGGIEGLVVRLIGKFMEIHKIDDTRVEVGAGMLDKTFANLMAEEEISGFEFLSTIPGNIGGGIKMNCGCFGGEIGENLVLLKGLDFKGNKLELKPHEIAFEYRKSNLPKEFIITSAVLKGAVSKKARILDLMAINQEKRNQTQPTGGKTAGSTFKNPKGFSAWELLEKAGLRGVKIGGASFSEKHLNFLLNDGTATAKDILSLGEHARKLVFEKCGIKLEWEVLHIGKFL
jgi:UDP-N-acetylmuramate dehydrogenase